METILNVLSAAGFVGSLALLAWGMALCISQGLDVGEPVNADASWRNLNPPAGTLS